MDAKPITTEPITIGAALDAAYAAKDQKRVEMLVNVAASVIQFARQKGVKKERVGIEVAEFLFRDLSKRCLSAKELRPMLIATITELGWNLEQAKDLQVFKE